VDLDKDLILEACLPILRKARAEPSGRRPFLTAQQIWISLWRNHHPICRRLLESSRAPRDRVPRDVLDRIAEAVANAPYVETRYLDARYVMFDLMDGRQIGAGGRDCRIFRLT
jgi:hypothetical protein